MTARRCSGGSDPTPRLHEALHGWSPPGVGKGHHVVGVFPGEGIGGEIVPVALEILEAACAKSSRRFDVRMGGRIGLAARAAHGADLSDEAIGFCEEVFRDGGAVFCGPGGGRFVYELRARFDLYCKFTPLKPMPQLADVGPLRPGHAKGVDIVAVRENAGGLYFGEWGRERTASGTCRAYHRFHYDKDQIARILEVASRLAASRRGRLCVTLKPGGVPAVSALWEEALHEVLRANGRKVEADILEVDNAAYQLIARAGDFDVIVSPNMFGDVLADCGALLLGSRGMSYSGNFGGTGVAVYQTAHGAARDLAGTDRANPIGQIFALTMMLRESFGWDEGADMIEAAVGAVLSQGIRTPDIASSGSHLVGTRELGQRIRDALDAAKVDAA